MSDKRQSLDMTPPARRKGGLAILAVIVLVVAAAGYFLLRDGGSGIPPVGQTGPSGQMRQAVPDREAPAGQGALPSANGSRAGAAGSAAVSAGQAAGTGQAAPGGMMTGDSAGDSAGAGMEPDAVAVPPVSEDSVIGPDFIDDTARWLVEGYYPRGTYPTALNEGVVVRDVKMLNTHVGVGMPGIRWQGDDIRKAREAVLAYVLSPAMVRGLYDLYSGQFMTAVERHADGLMRERRGREVNLSAAEKKEMYAIYSRLIRGLAAIAENVLDMPDAGGRVQGCLQARRATLDANAAFAEALHTYQMLVEQNAPYAEVQQALKDKDAAGKAFQQAIVERERKIAALAAELRRPGVSRALDDEGAVYVAMWIARRLETGAGVEPALREAVDVLRDVAQEFERRSR